MSLLKINLSGLEQGVKDLEKFRVALTASLKKATVLKKVGTLLAARAKRNIDESGQRLPEPWAPLAPSTIDKKWRSGGKKIISNAPMIDTGVLRKSLDFEVAADALFLTAVDYIKYHQSTEGRQHPETFPARPVFVVLAEDEEDIKDIIINDIDQGFLE